MLAAVAFISVLGLLVFGHELGHFLAAKKFGVKVEEFGFGFPPRLFGIKKGDTIYSLNLIPLGGFVKILGEDGEEKGNPRSFAYKKIWQRAIILSAGVLMNIILAIGLASLSYFFGTPTPIDDNENVENAWVQIIHVDKNSPASLAGIKAGDIIMALESEGAIFQDIKKASDFQSFVASHKDQKILIYIKRGQQNFAVEVTPRPEPPSGQGPLGVVLSRIFIKKYSWQRAIYEGAATVFDLLLAIFLGLGYFLWQLIFQTKVVGEVTGPIGIFNLTGQAAQLGFVYLINLTVFLSLNLAVVNIMPFPALDGGRLLFLLIEKIKGRPIKQAVEKIIHSIGFILLLLLMAFITLRDILKIF